ncbi:MAG: MBOAT family O-acyltransferase [Akkermansiaceae bacterium]
MLFNSWEFLILLAVTWSLYHIPVPELRRKTWQVMLLLVASALFYAWEEPRLLILLFGSCMVNAVAVERILFWKNRMILNDECLMLNEKDARKREASIQNSKFKIQNSDSRARRWLFWTVALNLAFLAFFKYAGFLANLFPDSLFPVSCKLWLSNIPLPVGISFYTFQGISLVVDVWRNDISGNTTEKLSARGRNRITSIRDTSFYISFFPQLVAGPIVKAHEFVDQIGAKCFADIDWITVRRSLVAGYFLKIFVADNLAEQTAFLSAGGAGLANASALNNLPLLYGYSLQIFADFAGYSLIAIGLGELFGYKLPPNFNFPYLSCSITEFWRRWHLSLSSWLRDYLYFPLGGNRKGAGRTYFNLFLVMFLGGLWHGAAWKFALWGSLHGLALAVERLMTRRDAGTPRLEDSEFDQEKTHTNPLPLHLCASARKFLSWFVTFHLVTLLWLTFMMPDMASIFAFFKSLVNGKTGFSGPPVFSLVFYGSMVVLYHVWGWLREHKEHFASHLSRSPLEPVLHGVMVFLVLTNPGAPRGFIYFQF